MEWIVNYGLLFGCCDGDGDCDVLVLVNEGVGPSRLPKALCTPGRGGGRGGCLYISD